MNQINNVMNSKYVAVVTEKDTSVSFWGTDDEDHFNLWKTQPLGLMARVVLYKRLDGLTPSYKTMMIREDAALTRK